MAAVSNFHKQLIDHLGVVVVYEYVCIITIARSCRACVHVLDNTRTATASHIAKSYISCSYIFVLLTAVKLKLLQDKEKPELGRNPSTAQQDDTVLSKETSETVTAAGKGMKTSTSAFSFFGRRWNWKVRMYTCTTSESFWVTLQSKLNRLHI